MKAKEKAKQLVDEFENYVLTDYRYDEEPIFEMQKSCALIAMEQRMELIQQLFKGLGIDYMTTEIYKSEQEVKQEIENL